MLTLNPLLNPASGESSGRVSAIRAFYFDSGENWLNKADDLFKDFRSLTGSRNAFPLQTDLFEVTRKLIQRIDEFVHSNLSKTMDLTSQLLLKGEEDYALIQQHFLVQIQN